MVELTVVLKVLCLVGATVGQSEYGMASLSVEWSAEPWDGEQVALSAVEKVGAKVVQRVGAMVAV